MPQLDAIGSGSVEAVAPAQVLTEANYRPVIAVQGKQGPRLNAITVCVPK